MPNPKGFGKRAMSNKDVATKYNVLKNTLSTWVKNKGKFLHSLEK